MRLWIGNLVSFNQKEYDKKNHGAVLKSTSRSGHLKFELDTKESKWDMQIPRRIQYQGESIKESRALFGIRYFDKLSDQCKYDITDYK